MSPDFDLELESDDIDSSCPTSGNRSPDGHYSDRWELHAPFFEISSLRNTLRFCSVKRASRTRSFAFLAMSYVK